MMRRAAHKPDDDKSRGHDGKCHCSAPGRGPEIVRSRANRLRRIPMNEKTQDQPCGEKHPRPSSAELQAPDESENEYREAGYVNERENSLRAIGHSLRWMPFAGESLHEVSCGSRAIRSRSHSNAPRKFAAGSKYGATSMSGNPMRVSRAAMPLRISAGSAVQRARASWTAR
jgi:hypothetical protein